MAAVSLSSLPGSGRETGLMSEMSNKEQAAPAAEAPEAQRGLLTDALLAGGMEVGAQVLGAGISKAREVLHDRAPDSGNGERLPPPDDGGFLDE